MIEKLAAIFTAWPPELATIVLAMLPVGELRGALPVALLVYKMPVVWAVFLSILGNILPVYFLLIFWERAAGYISERSDRGRRALDWLHERTRRKLDHKIKKYGYWALALFVAVPLPVTGAWTGTIAAYVFGLPKKQSFLAIFIGVVISAAIVTFISLGGAAVVRYTLFNG